MTIPRWIGLACMLALLATLAGVLATRSPDHDATVADVITHTTGTETSPGEENSGPSPADGRDNRATNGVRRGATGHGTDDNHGASSTGSGRQGRENQRRSGRSDGADGSRGKGSDDSAPRRRGDGTGTRRRDSSGTGRDGMSNDAGPNRSTGDGGADRDNAGGSGDKADGGGGGGVGGGGGGGGDDGGSGSTTASNEVELGPPLVDPKEIHFGFVAIGESRALTITLRNRDPRETRSITGVDMSDEIDSEFDLAENNCLPAKLAPSEACALRVTFTPSARGDHHATLAITDATYGKRDVLLAGTTSGGTGPDPAPEPELTLQG